MSIEIDFSYAIDGFYHSVNYYRSETPMDPEAMPAATATGITDLTYTDTTATKGINYYVRFGSVRGGVEKISSEYRVLAGMLWTPSNMTTTKTIYLDSDSFVLTSGAVSQWSDKSGNNNHFTAGAASTRPALSALNGNEIAVFDGIDDYLNNTNKTIFRNMGKGWLFMVSKRIAGANILTHNCATTNSGNLRFGRGATMGTARLDSGSIINPTGTTGTVNNEWGLAMCIADWSGGNLALYLDGGSTPFTNTFSAGLTSNTDSANGTTLGRFTPTNATVTQCEVACLIMGNTNIPTADEINKLMGWAAHKYGLTGKLPSDHPYKANPPVV